MSHMPPTPLHPFLRAARPAGVWPLAVLSAGFAGSSCAGERTEAPVAEPVLAPALAPVQPELFAAPGAWPNAWADYDGDGDLDLFVGFSETPNRLYRNDGGSFTDVAAEVGLADVEATRAAAWGDFDLDGDVDLYVGFDPGGPPNRLYRNDADAGFVDVAREVGLDHRGQTRQPTFIDYDGDGDLDLFVAFRDGPNRLARNDGEVFTDVTETAGIGDARRSVGAAWFDVDDDGDLDLFVANQEGDEDALYRNRGDGTFEDVASELGMHRPGRSAEQGSVGVALSDADNDGDIDLFVASYGPDVLWQNQGDGTFVDVAPGTPLAADHHSVGAAWGDYDNDGWADVYVATFLSAEPEAADHLFRNAGGVFEDVTPEAVLAKGASHAVSWADHDLDGDLDLALTNVSAGGAHPLYRNDLDPARAGRSLQIGVVDTEGRWTRAGATITVQSESGDWVGSRVLDSGGGYNAQSVMPTHVGLPPGVERVSVTVTWFERGQKRWSTVSGVAPQDFRSDWVRLQLGVR